MAAIGDMACPSAFAHQPVPASFRRPVARSTRELGRTAHSWGATLATPAMAARDRQPGRSYHRRLCLMQARNGDLQVVRGAMAEARHIAGLPVAEDANEDTLGLSRLSRIHCCTGRIGMQATLKAQSRNLHHDWQAKPGGI